MLKGTDILQWYTVKTVIKYLSIIKITKKSKHSPASIENPFTQEDTHLVTLLETAILQNEFNFDF